MLTSYLNPKNTTDCQFIYATVQKGSFYCIYIKLNKKKNSDILESLDFYLENYKGKKRRLKENSIIIEYDKDKSNILRIAFKTKKGILTNAIPKNVSHLEINAISGLKAIFVTRNKEHFAKLKEFDRDKIIEFVEAPNNEGNELFWNLNKNLNLNKEDLLLAVGRNCVTSYIKVNEG